MYLLETLTAGMYNQPLSIYREYIQNAVDSIDSSDDHHTDMLVEIKIDPFAKKIEIRDNGEGLLSENAEQVLSNIGVSNKIDRNLRGFRGIGRLGGIAFSEKVIFQTKARGETIESIQVWDCVALNRIISNKKNNSMSLRSLFNKTTKFYQQEVNRKGESYFKVILEGVSSYKNHLFDIERIKNYLSEIAPLPFDYDTFTFGQEIDEFLTNRLKIYGKHKVTLNGESLLKPYSDILKVTKGGLDLIERIELFDIVVKDEPIAYGWYGLRKDLLGSISKGERSSGIKVRLGNILIGDAHLLDACFREPRFNSYVAGEIHIESDKLTPNSRRDDFVDNEYKGLFYNEFERIVGLPLSREIRQRSKLASVRPKSTGCAPSVNSELSSKIDVLKSEKDFINSQMDCEHLSKLLEICIKCKKLNNCMAGSMITKILLKN